MLNRRRSRCQACALWFVAIRSCLAFAPSLVARSATTRTSTIATGTSPATTYNNREHIPLRRAAATAETAVGPLRALADEDEDDDGEELVGMAEFLAQKAVRDRDRLLAGRSPPSPMELVVEEDDDDDDNDGEELVGRAEFLAQKAQRERRMEERQSPSLSSTPPRATPAVDLGMKGGIFPSDVFPGSASDEITLRGAKLEPGQPEALVGFWKVRSAACSFVWVPGFDAPDVFTSARTL